MNKKLIKALSIFVIAGAVSAGTAFAISGCSKKDDGDDHTHTAGTTWEHDATNHWHVCTGGDNYVMDSAAHSYGNDNVCDVCGYEKASTATATVSSVKVTASASTVKCGGTVSLTVSVTGTNSPAQTVTWKSSDETVATVSESGVVTALKAGQVTITATSTVDATKSGTVTLTVEAEEVEVDVTGTRVISTVDTTQLVATVTGTDNTAVTWKSSDETTATVSESGLVTPLKAGQVTITATSVADSSVSDSIEITITDPGKYNTYANKSNNVVKENFDSITEGTELTLFTSWGTAGVYEDKAKAITVSSNGQATSNTSLGSNMNLVIDLGSVEGVVEGYLEFGFLATASSNGNSVQFCNGDDVVLKLITNATAFEVTASGVSGTTKATTTCNTSNTYGLEFSFDLTNKTVTLKLGDETLLNNVSCDITQLTGIKVATSNSGQRGIVVDNIAVCGNALTAATQKTRKAALISALETAYTELAATTNYTTAKSTYETAVAAATTVAEVDTAYNTYYASALAAAKTLITSKIEALGASGYTQDATKLTTYKEGLKTTLTATTTVEAAMAVADELTTAKLEAQGIHSDAYYSKVDVTIVLYEKGTTTSVAATGATLTSKDGESFTLAQLKAAVDVPSGKAISGIYTDAECTNEVTTSYTLNANGATTATTNTLYVVFVAVTTKTYTLDVTKITSTLSEETQINDIFYGTNGVKAESIKNNVEGYEKQVSLTGGKATTTSNSIKFTISNTATITIVCGQKTGKTTNLVVLGSDGKDATVSNLQKDGVSVDGFATLSTNSTADTYTFTLEAGTYYIGGAGGGAYIYSLTVAETTVASGTTTATKS